MRLLVFIVAVCFGLGSAAESSHAKAIKVFRFLVDADGLHARSSSLLDRDAYQAYLREHPAKVNGLRFIIQWKRRSESPAQPAIRVEVRHGNGNTIGEFAKTAPVKVRKTRRSQWHQITISGEEYVRLGKVIAWRVSLWDGETMLAQAESFLW